MTPKSSDTLRSIPSVEKVKRLPHVAQYLREYSEDFVTGIVREVLDDLRRAHRMRKKPGPPADPDSIQEDVLNRVSLRLSSPLHRVINGAGIIVHTNLGRSILGLKVLSAICEAAAHYCNLEIDLETGDRGHRDSLIAPLVCEVTGAEAATVVNNNAAAVTLALDTLAKGREVIVSRGELIEIGGSFRMPDVMAKSGAKLVEVGTTNKTYITDYEKALSPETSLLLKVHPSNYAIIGFTHNVCVSELVELGMRRGIPVMEDLGSGALVDMTRFGLCNEPMPQDSIKAGADVVTFSGDKLLGGPQAGIILGKREYIEAIRKNPLMRAFRVDKMVIAALGALFRILSSSRQPEKEIPTLALIARTPDEIRELAQRAYDAVKPAMRKSLDIEIIEGESRVGGGSAPGQTLPTRLLVMKPKKLSADEIARQLRQYKPAIVGFIRNDAYCLDFRTIQPEEISELAAALNALAPQ